MITFTELLVEIASAMDLSHGSGKELKNSPDYKRDERRKKQAQQSAKETNARVKRGYTYYSDKDEWGNLKLD